MYEFNRSRGRWLGASSVRHTAPHQAVAADRTCWARHTSWRLAGRAGAHLRATVGRVATPLLLNARTVAILTKGLTGLMMHQTGTSVMWMQVADVSYSEMSKLEHTALQQDQTGHTDTTNNLTCC